MNPNKFSFNPVPRALIFPSYLYDVIRMSRCLEAVADGVGNNIKESWYRTSRKNCLSLFSWIWWIISWKKYSCFFVLKSTITKNTDSTKNLNTIAFDKLNFNLFFQIVHNKVSASTMDIARSIFQGFLVKIYTFYR